MIAIFLVNFVSFYLNKKLTFRTRKKLFWRELWKFYSVMASSHFINILGVFFFGRYSKSRLFIGQYFLYSDINPF